MPVEFKRDDTIIHLVFVVRGSIEKDLQSSEVTEQEIDEQDEWLSESKELDG
jgi:hypothetical protein